MSKFHDELVSARRRGEAPGQAADEAPLLSNVNPVYTPVESNPVVCSRCGAAVPTDRAPFHSDWHRQLGS